MARPKRLSTDWTKHLKEDEKKDFQAAVLNDRLVLGRLADIIEEKLQTIQRKELTASEYDTPSWAYRQAHLNGIKAGLTTIRDLLPE